MTGNLSGCCWVNEIGHRCTTDVRRPKSSAKYFRLNGVCRTARAFCGEACGLQPLLASMKVDPAEVRRRGWSNLDESNRLVRFDVSIGQSKVGLDISRAAPFFALQRSRPKCRFLHEPFKSGFSKPRVAKLAKVLTYNLLAPRRQICAIYDFPQISFRTTSRSLSEVVRRNGIAGSTQTKYDEITIDVLLWLLDES